MAFERLISKARAVFEKMARVLDNIKLPGFQGVGLFQVMRLFWLGLSDRRFSLSAMGLAYRFMFTLFPALILVFTLVPHDLHAEVLNFFNTVVPSEAFFVVSNVVDEFFDKPGFGLISFNFLVMLYSALSGIKALMFAFSRENEMFEQRNFFRTNLIALLIFIILMVLFLAILAVLVFAEYYILYGGDTSSPRTDWTATLFRIGYWVVILVGLELGVAVLYYLAPETKQRWSFFSPGSLLAGFLTLAAILGFQLFVGQFANFNKIYGSISALMLLMFWFYWISVVLMVGFELNAAIDKARLANGDLDISEAKPEIPE